MSDEKKTELPEATEDVVVPVEEPKLPPKPLSHSDLVEKYKPKVLKVYKSMPPASHISHEDLARKVGAKTPLEIKAAAHAWHKLYDEKLVAVPQFYKPPAED